MSFINSPFSRKDSSGSSEIKDLPPFKKVEVKQDSLEKVETTTKSWWDTFATAGTLASQVAQSVYSVTYDTGEKEKLIESANDTILEKLDDKNGKMLVKLSNYLGDVASDVAKKSVESSANEYIGSYLGAYLGSTVGNMSNYYLDVPILTKTFVSQAFANLATHLHNEKLDIPNYDNQPALLSLFSIIIKNSSTHLNRKVLSTIEDKYKENIIGINKLTDQFWPSPEDKIYVKTLITKYFNADTIQKKEAILKDELFDDYYKGKETPSQESDTEQFLHHLAQLNKRNNELKSVFKEFSDEILTYIFPEKYDDPSIQKFIKGEELFNIVFSGIQGAIASTLFTEYNSMELNNYQTHELESRVGYDIKPLIKAPSEFLAGYAKNYIQFNPSMPVITNDLIHGIVYPVQPEDKDKPLDNEKKAKIAEEKEEIQDLSDWFLEFLQAGTHTDDPNFKGLATYGKEKVDTVAGAIVMKAMNAFFAEEEVVGAQLLQKIVDVVSVKLKSEDEVTFLVGLPEIIADLPIPISLKNTALTNLEKAAEYEAKMLEMLKNADVSHKKSVADIKSYKGGDELFSFVENLTKEIVKYLKEKNVGLISDAGLDDTIQDMLNEFLPGLKLDEGLKNLLRDNLKLTNAEDISNLSEKAIQTILCTSLKTTIDANFDLKLNCADQLFSKIKSSFKGTLNTLIETENAQLKDALVIQSRIDIENKKITELNKKLVLQPQINSVALQSAIDDVMVSARRVGNALKYVDIASKYEAFDNEIMLRSAKHECVLRENEYNEKRAIFNGLKGKTENEKSFEELSSWLNVTLSTRKELNEHVNNIATLEKDLDQHLRMYQSLSNDLMGFIGLDAKEKLTLPVSIVDQAWPKIQDAKNAIIPRLLFRITSPIVSNVQELEHNKEELNKLSGSPFLSKLSEAIADDLFTQVPQRMKSLTPVANEIFQLLGKRDATAPENELLLKEILLFVREPEKYGKLTNKTLLLLFEKVAVVKLSDKDLVGMKKLLDENKIKERIVAVNITPDEIRTKFKNSSPVFDEKIIELILTELKDTFGVNQVDGLNSQIPVKDIITGSLLKFLIPIAEKNPSANGKDSLIILTEKLLEFSTEKFLSARTKPFKEVAKEIESAIMAPGGFGLSEAIATLNAPLRDRVSKMITGKIESSLILLQKTLKPYSAVQPLSQNATVNLINGVSDTVARTVMDTLPATLNEVSGANELKMVAKITSNINRNLELAAESLKVAEVLLNYAQGTVLEEILINQVAEVAKAENLIPEKNMASVLVGTIVAESINHVVNACIAFEEDHKNNFDHLFMVNIVQAAADHLTMINSAEDIAKSAGRDRTLHSDFISAGSRGGLLHPALLVKTPDYQQSFEAICEKLDIETMTPVKKAELTKAIENLVKDEQLNGIPITNERINNALIPIFYGAIANLTDEKKKSYTDKLAFFDKDTKSLKSIIVDEMNAPALQRQENFYNPATKSLLKLLFPNGKDDLTFVPEDVRAQTWKMFKNNVFPAALPMITDSILDPGTINGIVLSILENTKKNLDREIVITPEMQEPPSALDEAAASLMVQIMARMDLPPLARNIIIDPVTGEITPSMKKTLGDYLRGQIINSNFLKTSLESALQSVISGEPVAPSTQTNLEKAAEMEPKIRKAAGQVVDSKVSNYIRTKWHIAQAKFDKFVFDTFGNIGAALKKGLDMVFRFVFFTIIGKILSWTLFPVCKKIIHNYLSVDKNIDALLEPFRKIPEDQGGNQAYAVYNENLIYNLVKGVEESLKQSLEIENEAILKALQSQNNLGSQGLSQSNQGG